MSISRRLSVISFDAFSTLLKPAGGVGAQYASAAKRLAGLTLDPDVLESAFLVELRRQRTAFPNYGYERRMTARKWWTQVVTNTFKNAMSSSRSFGDGSSLDRLLSDVAGHLFDNFDCDLYPNVELLLRHLKETHNLRLCVISNSDERLEGFLQARGVADYFDLILTSRGVGVEKPHPEIFRTALRHFGGGDVGTADEKTSNVIISPETFLHVGDDLERDFVAARMVGMKALIVDHRRKMARNQFVCHDLVELMDKIDEMVFVDASVGTS